MKSNHETDFTKLIFVQSAGVTPPKFLPQGFHLCIDWWQY